MGWRHRHLGEEASAQLTMLVGSARASLECAAAGTLGALSSAAPPLTTVAAAGTVKNRTSARIKPSSAEFLMELHSMYSQVGTGCKTRHRLMVMLRVMFRFCFACSTEVVA